MISDEIIKDKFITDTVMKGLDAIQRVQIQRAMNASPEVQKMFNMEDILSDIRNRNLQVIANHGFSMFSLSFIKKVRFADMKKLGNLKIYNKKIWGQMYVDTYPELQAGLTNEIKIAIREELEQAGSVLNTKK
jgi:hypothetical protein